MSEAWEGMMSDWLMRCDGGVWVGGYGLDG